MSHGLPQPVTVADMYQAAILAALERIEAKLDTLQPRPAVNVELREPMTPHDEAVIVPDPHSTSGMSVRARGKKA